MGHVYSVTGRDPLRRLSPFTAHNGPVLRHTKTQEQYLLSTIPLHPRGSEITSSYSIGYPYARLCTKPNKIASFTCTYIDIVLLSFFSLHLLWPTQTDSIFH